MLKKKYQEKMHYSRRDFVKSAILSCGCVLPGVSYASQYLYDNSAIKKNYAGKPPNVILIMTDDQGYGDFSCHGNPLLKTPHMDRLYSESVRFTDFHVTPVCSPTRGQLMSGQDAFRNGARTVPGGYNLIWRDIPIMPEVFRANGYHTGHFGKWHLGDVYPDRPFDRGFDKALWLYGHGVNSSAEFNNDTHHFRYRDGVQVVQSDRYSTDVWFEEAMKWMDDCRTKQKPFFCSIPTMAPHGPRWPLKADEKPYVGKVDPVLAEHFGSIAGIDRNLGHLLDWMEETGLEQDTILIFLTDNGSSRGTQFFNAGLRAGKGSYYDGGHRAASFWRWPGGAFRQACDVHTPGQVQDVLPTLIDLCDLKNAQDMYFDGVSLAPLLRDSDAFLPDRKMIVQYGRRTRPVKGDGCVIWGKWRMVNYEELYDIEKDRGQQNNVAGQYPEVLRVLHDWYQAWWEGVEGRLFDYQPILVGTDVENPVLLNPNMWQGADVDNNGVVAQASRAPGGAPWGLDVQKSGRYQIELRRWPFHTGFPLGSQGPVETVYGRPVEFTGRQVPIAESMLILDDQQSSMKVSMGDAGAIFEENLKSGPLKMQAWFRDDTGTDACAAFYARILQLEE
jgi:arylsulfatase A-like enzyme